MGFFFNSNGRPQAAKKAPSPRQHVPLQLMQELGCKVCPLDKTCKGESPKMEPSGPDGAFVYILGTSPNEIDDRMNIHWAGRMGDALASAFGRDFLDRARSNYIVQCLGEVSDQALACCRGRVIADIERVRPTVVITIGDAALRWATGLPNKITALLVNGGTYFIPAQIGNHACLVYPMLYPNFIHSEGAAGKRRAGWQPVFERDAEIIRKLVQNGELKTPRIIPPAERLAGIEFITGNETKALVRLENFMADWISSGKRVGFDIETNSLRPWKIKDPQVYCAALGDRERVLAFPLDDPRGWPSGRQKSRAWGLLGEFLLESGPKLCHNLAMEMEWMLWYFGPQILRRTEWHDSLILANVLDEREGIKSLDIQTHLRLGFSPKALTGVDPTRYLEYPIEKDLVYCGSDVKYTDLIWQDMEMDLLFAPDSPTLWEQYEHKLRLAPTLVLTESIGMDVDLEFAAECEAKLEAEQKKARRMLEACPEVQQFRKRFGAFDPGNSNDVLKLYRDLLQRPEVKREDYGGAVSYTTDEEALSSMPASEVPSAALILDLRGAEKLQSTYIQPLMTGKIVSPHDGKIHSKYSSTTAETGRLASEDPNIQNWPKRKHRYIRKCIRAGDDRVMVAIDYGQIEFRVGGMATEDPAIVEPCWVSYDVHQFWAERLVSIYPRIVDIIVEKFSVDWEEKGLKTLRQEMKNGWVFPQIFGSSIAGCAQALGIPMEVGEDLGQEFWDTFRVTKRWQEKLLAKYEKNLYVETLTGRKRRGFLSKQQIINHPFQGTAADIVTRAMTEISEKCEMMDRMDRHPTLNVHDDLTYDLREATLREDITWLATEMCRHHFDFINVPIVVEVSIGPNWHELEEVAKYRSDELFGYPNPFKQK